MKIREGDEISPVTCQHDFVLLRRIQRIKCRTCGIYRAPVFLTDYPEEP